MIVVQLTDPHVSESRPVALERFEAAIADVLAQPMRPDVVVVTGDLTDHGAPEEYARARAALSALPCPAYVLAGNHDDRAALRAAFGPQGTQVLEPFVQYVVDSGPLRLLALDTTIPGENGGELDAERLAWLEARLAESRRPALVLMHHPPFAVGLEPMDAIGLGDADAFGDVIARHAPVEAIVAGHVHLMVVRRFRGTVAMTAVATSSRIDFDLSRPDRLALVEGPIEYLVHAWSPEHGLRTSVRGVAIGADRREIHDGTRWLAH